MTEYLLEARNLRKQFGTNTVLKDVDLCLSAGEVHAIVGENGAGKSTLIKILAGVHRADGGSVVLAGQSLDLSSPQAALRHGIVVIHQELSLAPHLTAEENIFLGHFPRTPLGLINRRKMRDRTRELLDRLSIDIDASVPVGRLSIAQQQMIEIAKAISVDARILVLDEPTAVLDAHRVDTLFELIERLKAQGIGVIFISHHLEEVFRIADRVTVLRDGERTGTEEVRKVDQDWLVTKMIGRDFERQAKRKRSMGEVALTLEGLSSEGAFEDVTFELREGEILGLAGLIGAGRTEIAQAIFGLRRVSSGTIRVLGRLVSIKNPGTATRHGIAYVSEDRQAFGLLPNRSVRENATISNLARFRSFGMLRLDREHSFVRDQIDRLDIRLPSMQSEIRTLSGGNQQKVLLSRAMANRPRVLIFDEPTRGVDIGAKREIYSFIEDLAENGAAIIVISSEMEEVLRLADRVLVIRGGRVAAELPGSAATEERIMRAASLD
ncbi:sugar ABC transporter ATP-binding protein [uncultured Limimaricola sp.]|uniref:sugar ABC transporter ATP-binding protein n=1 Tax=uncultured Limimaricola sp. TaxID=2211667 RepID=UPI0030F706B0